MKLVFALLLNLLLTTAYAADTVYILAPQTLPVTPSNAWVGEAPDFGTIVIGGTATCRYGAADKWVYVRLTTGTYTVLPATFNVPDPAPNVKKTLSCWSGPALIPGPIPNLVDVVPPK